MTNTTRNPHHAPEPPVAVELQPFRETNVVAVYPHPDRAREVLAALERDGLDGGQASFVSGAPPMGRADRRFLGLTARRLGVGVLGGVLAGLILGVIVGGVVSATSDTSGATVWSATLVGLAAFGAAVGAFYSLFARSAASTAWRETFAADPDAPARIVVHLDDGDRTDDIRRVLELGGPTAISVLDQRGRPIESPAP
ncbi:MAG: hypothetical protein RIE08_12140 [Acidimicrobiales bacterium]